MSHDGAHVTGWLAGGATARGASHHRSGLPNQDSIGWIAPGAGLRRGAMVVSDGHGGKAHDRSHDGSRLAVECALAEFVPLLAEGADTDAAFAEARAGIAARIHERWKRRLAELTGAADEAMMVRHGATLVAVACGDESLLLVQLGDGDILIGRRDATLERPLPEDDGLTGEQTHSLCETDAPGFARTAIIARGRGGSAIDFVMASTDGLAKSFPDDASFLDLARHYRGLISTRGLGAVTDGLGDWLAAASANGSADDVSLGFLVSPELAGRASFTPSAAGKAGSRLPAVLAALLAGCVLTAAAMHAGGWRRVEPAPVAEPAKPEAASPVESKPADAKPADAKPAEQQPAEQKPADAKPAEEKPATAEPKP